jgi:hypothetical protein
MYQAQIINSTASGKPEFAVLPYEEYLSLLELKAKQEGFDSVEDYLDYQEAAYIIQTDTGRIPFEEIKRQLKSSS